METFVVSKEKIKRVKSSKNYIFVYSFCTFLCLFILIECCVFYKRYNLTIYEPLTEPLNLNYLDEWTQLAYTTVHRCFSNTGTITIAVELHVNAKKTKIKLIAYLWLKHSSNTAAITEKEEIKTPMFLHTSMD